MVSEAFKACKQQCLESRERRIANRPRMKDPTLFEVALPDLNLDGRFPATLQTMARELGQVSVVFQKLRTYAKAKADAMVLREEKGNIVEAQRREKICEDIYKKLPPWAKW